MNTTPWLTGFGLGWGLSYLLDPAVGGRRRAVIRDKAIRATNVLEDAVDTTARDVHNRMRGVIADLRAWRSPDTVSDPVLVARVRARLGGSIRHPRSIEVTARERRVTLRGPILADEVLSLLQTVASLRGVRGVNNRLEIHAEPGDVPGLQGDPGRWRGGERFELLQAQWSPTARLLMGLAGGVLLGFGIHRQGVIGTLVGTGGLVMLARALTNLELKRLFGIGAGQWAVTVHKTVTVAAPIEQVFDVWSRYENFPRFMAHVREVRRTGEGRAQWTVAGPAGVPIQWETVEMLHEPPELLAWTTTKGAPVGHAGIVRFDQYAEGTRIHIQMHYNPPAGAVGHALAALLGADPKRALDEDLVRFKSLLEDGKTSVRGQTVTLDALA
jgi:uncharacterized membrane protein